MPSVAYLRLCLPSLSVSWGRAGGIEPIGQVARLLAIVAADRVEQLRLLQVLTPHHMRPIQQRIERAKRSR
jgi:hypothetical protein